MQLSYVEDVLTHERKNISLPKHSLQRILYSHPRAPLRKSVRIRWLAKRRRTKATFSAWMRATNPIATRFIIYLLTLRIRSSKMRWTMHTKRSFTEKLKKFPKEFLRGIEIKIWGKWKHHTMTYHISENKAILPPQSARIERRLLNTQRVCRSSPE